MERVLAPARVGVALFCLVAITFSPTRYAALAHALEALANVRKHSDASNVLVRLEASEEVWKLTIDDDGQGFGFSGRRSLAELDASRLGPRVIQARMRSIGGDLSIDSAPGGGALLEITVRSVAHG